MPFVRAIFAALVAISVVFLPVAGVAAFKVKTADLVHMHDNSAADSMHDCCPPDTDPCKGIDCLSMAGCFVTPATLSGVSATLVEFPPLLAGTMPRLNSEPPDSLDGSPPFRPPRV